MRLALQTASAAEYISSPVTMTWRLYRRGWRYAGTAWKSWGIEGTRHGRKHTGRRGLDVIVYVMYVVHVVHVVYEPNLIR